MEIILTFQTTRAAINGERRLLAAGLKIKTMALPSALGDGCGLCLRLEESDFNAALETLKSVGLEPKGVFSRLVENGRSVYRVVPDNSGGWKAGQ